MPAESPGRSLLALRVTVAFAFLLTSHWATAGGSLVLARCSRSPAGTRTSRTRHDRRRASRAAPPARTAGGAWSLFVATEATLFGTLVGTWVYLRFENAHWPPPPLAEPTRPDTGRSSRWRC